MNKENETVKTYLKVFLFIVAILMGFFMIISFEFIKGSSMEPNYLDGDIVLIEKLSKRFKNYDRGDVVVLISPEDDHSHLIKRIIGVPTERVEIADCKINITGDDYNFILEEEYIEDYKCTKDALIFKVERSVRLDKDQYYVLGDNRGVSLDSRFFGEIDEKRIMGKAVFRIWPLWSFGFLP